MHFLFAWRYFKAKKTTNAINIIAWISIGAIVIGTAALVLVLSVFNGFEGLVKSLYSSFYTDLKILPASGKLIHVSDAQLLKMRGLSGINNFSLVVEEKALVQAKSRAYGSSEETSQNQQIVYLKGVDENYRYVSGVGDNLFGGEYDLGDEERPMVILGAGLEAALDINVENHLDPLIVYLPRKTGTETIDPLNDVSGDTIRTAAAFMIQQDFDNKYGITNIGFIKRALQLQPDEYSGIEISLKDPGNEEEVKKELQVIFGKDYLVQNKFQQNKNLYSIMNLERWFIYAIASLILMVAAFNMIGALRMLSLEKQKDIAALQAMGANKWFIQKIFLSEGFLLAIIGCGIGMLLALTIALLQIKYHLIPLSGGSFLINYFPVKLRGMDFILVGATVFVIALVASWFPSRKAAKQDFSLRSE